MYLNINSMYLSLFFHKNGLGELYQYKLLTLLIRGVTCGSQELSHSVFEFFTTISFDQKKSRYFRF